MFRFHKTLDVITLFHKASVPSSMRVQATLKQASGASSEHATQDQASSTPQIREPREPFELEVSEQLPTPDQLKNILDYIKPLKASAVISGATDESSAMKKLNSDTFQWPVIVDWTNGKAIVGDKESEILKLLSKSKDA